MLNTNLRQAIAMALAVSLLTACGMQVTSTFQVITSGPFPSQEPVIVTLVDSSFGPNITIPTGTTLTFQNDGGLRHTASHGTDGQLAEDSLFDFVLEPGDSVSWTFDTPGTYPITCIVHPTMNMTITVE